MKKRKFTYSAYWLAAMLFTSTPAAAEAGYQKQTGSFVKLEFPTAHELNARSLQPAAPTAQLIMPDDNQQITLHPTRRYQDFSAFSGKIKAPQNQAEDEDVIVVKSDRGGFLMLFTHRQQIIYQSATGEQTLLTFDQDTNTIQDETVMLAESKTAIAMRSLNLQDRSSRAAADIDAEGNYVIDILAGFSIASAQIVIDPEAYAFAQVESINQALRNSQIDGIKIRLVGIQIIDQDYPIHNSNLSLMTTAFARGIEQYSPDLVAGFFVGDKAINNATAWSYVNGSISINNIASPTALRHEIGHNAGGHHCSDATTSGYAYGWDNGKSQTIMCGNTSGYYSNPNLKDKFGLPLGNVANADMARVWHEAKARMSSYRPAVVPLNNEKVTLLAEQRIDLNAANNYRAGLQVKIPENVGKVVIAALHGEDFLEDGKYTLDVAEVDDITTEHYGSDTQYYPSYTIAQPKTDSQFYASVRSKGVNLEGILLRVWAFTQELENSGAESGDLSGWIQEQGQFRVIASQDGILPATGKYYFTARNSSKEANYAETDRITQTIAVNPLTITPNTSARLTFMSNGWGDGDYGTATLTAKNKAGAILNQSRVTTTGYPQKWSSYSVDLSLPEETSQVEVRIDAYPIAGAMNDVHFDDFHFSVTY
ncbi:hypothetical protein COO59_09275 [Mixta theicola]|uniref:Carbohydrate-binding protein n=1 Tax=Mixta theicola TaxID=1458355 RepID=A0A2K1QAV6_9GAMM|nr:hypothetical protein [Mixta theicola]PNS12156.1 hypothetical protein COO59_09275 [Mixta theicola]GLR10670.1 hypothetical protein GCM10007905_33900 [Mixta theicola]